MSLNEMESLWSCDQRSDVRSLTTMLAAVLGIDSDGPKCENNEQLDIIAIIQRRRWRLGSRRLQWWTGFQTHLEIEPNFLINSCVT